MSRVTDLGIEMDTFDDIKTTLISEIESIFGASINVDNASRFGQLINIISERIADQNELIQTIANSQDPSSAVGVWLEQLVRLNGITKNEPAKSTVVLQITTNSAGTTVFAGDLVEIEGSSGGSSVGERFEIDSTTVIGPSTTGNVSASAVNYGAIIAETGTITKIVTPRFGWASVANISDAIVGNVEESSQDLRIRRELAATQTGNSSITAIKRKLADLDNITQVAVYQNKDNDTDTYGVPGHTVWPIVVGGTDLDIAALLFGVVGAGVGMYGNTTYSYPDPVTGENWDVKWSYGVEVPIYIKVRTKKSTKYPGDGDVRIKQNIVDFFNGGFTLNGVEIESFALGDDVVSSRIYTPANGVTGHEIVEILISTSVDPTVETTIALTPEQYAGTVIENIEVENVI